MNISLKFVHPAIIDLYVASLKQSNINYIIDGYGEVDRWPEGISDLIVNMANELNEKHQKALSILGSEIEIAQQLDYFDSMGGTA